MFPTVSTIFISALYFERDWIRSDRIVRELYSIIFIRVLTIISQLTFSFSTCRVHEPAVVAFSRLTVCLLSTLLIVFFTYSGTLPLMLHLNRIAGRFSTLLLFTGIKIQ